MPKSVVTIKGTPQSLVIYLSTEEEFAEVRSALKKHLESAKGFFAGAKYRFHNSINAFSEEQQKTLSLICTDYGLVPYETEGDSKCLTFAIKGLKQDELDQENSFINRHIRSGEKQFYKGNVILIGDINPGVEITATGNIIVFGSARGTLHAGAEGGRDCFIIASLLDPLQIRISDVIARKPENGYNNKTIFKPEIATIENNQIVIKQYLTKSLAEF
ncbi:MAG: septum site-determining protein MinC [Bacillota bacterium]